MTRRDKISWAVAILAWAYFIGRLPTLCFMSERLLAVDR